jgi:hypothetical protein
VIEFSRETAVHYAHRLGVPLDAAAILSPARRRAALPPWLVPELVATDAARVKLDAWFDRGMPDAPAAEELLGSETFIGDEIANHSAARTIAAMPPPIACYVAAQCRVLVLGAQMLGFCSAPIQTDRPWLLAIVARDSVELFESIVVHEAAHAWLLPEPAPGTRAPSAFESATLRTVVAPPDLVETLAMMRRAHARNEAQCRDLVRALGYRDPSDFG